MKKNTKVFFNIILVLTFITSLAWGTVVRGFGNWGPRAYSTWWNDEIFWANICQIVIPIVTILLLVFINKKR